MYQLYYPLIMMQWCNLTLVWRFWATTKVCLRASKTSKICLLGCPTGQATFSHRLTSKTSQKYNRSIITLWGTLLWISRTWFMKTFKKNLHFTTNIYIYIYESQKFWSFMKFYFVHIVKVCFIFKKQSLCLYFSVHA